MAMMVKRRRDEEEEEEEEREEEDEEEGRRRRMRHTCVVQDAILDNMGPDFRCQNEVMTTKNC